jgi:hypothetical protein
MVHWVTGSSAYNKLFGIADKADLLTPPLPYETLEREIFPILFHLSVHLHRDVLLLVKLVRTLKDYLRVLSMFPCSLQVCVFFFFWVFPLFFSSLIAIATLPLHQCTCDINCAISVLHRHRSIPYSLLLQ